MRAKMLVLLTGLSLFGCKTPDNAPTAAGKVDLVRYAGLWYDVASYPARFQKGCHCTTAEYSLTAHDYIIVVNKCRKGGFDQREGSVTGKAFIVKGSNNTKLRVQFFWPFRADYHIVRLDPDYRWAVVSSGRNYLWILSRTPVLDEHVFDSIVSSLKKDGFDTGRLVRTPQPCN